MRYFIMLSALFGIGLSGLLPGGYNYNSGISFNHNAILEPAFKTGLFQGYPTGHSVNSFQNQGPHSTSSGNINVGVINPTPQSGFSSLPEESPRHEAPLITKQFYLHSAPEEHDTIEKSKHFVLGRPQKNYRVVFIKAPSSTSANVHLSAEYAPQEEKTVIYVLSKKEHELDVNDIATPPPTQPSKPEVFFIKYKTPEEAAHAQAEIQKQYEVLGGQSQVVDEGHAPVSDISGVLVPPTPSPNSHSNIGYLPPSNTKPHYHPPQH